MEQIDPAERFAALGHPARLAVLRLLVQAGPQGLPAGDIAARLDALAKDTTGARAVPEVIDDLGPASGPEVTRTRVHIAALRAWATHHDPTHSD